MMPIQQHDERPPALRSARRHYATDMKAATMNFADIEKFIYAALGRAFLAMRLPTAAAQNTQRF